MAQRHEKAIWERGNPMVNDYLKKSSNLLSIRAMRIKLLVVHEIGKNQQIEKCYLGWLEPGKTRALIYYWLE